jgi:predicted Fe-S protein YdhL (DUF1289 family)
MIEASLQPQKLLPSPCIGVCRIDPVTGLCLGCARTADEIAAWRTVDPDARAAVWAALPARRARLGISIYRLDWGRAKIRAFVDRTLCHGAGTWVFGVPGAVAEFSMAPEEQVRITGGIDTIAASTGRGAVRLRISEGLRALAIPADGASGRIRAIVLALIRDRLDLPVHRVFAPLGADHRAIRGADRRQQLFDFGLGRYAAQFCIRTGEPSLIARLEAAAGATWPDALEMLGDEILRTSPHRVVRTGIGRAEVFTPIPQPGEKSPAGPHTHFLPRYLAADLDVPPGIELPAAYVLGAIFYPTNEIVLNERYDSCP